MLGPESDWVRHREATHRDADRSATLRTGGYLEQADGTAWMALFSQNMLELADAAHG